MKILCKETLLLTLSPGVAEAKFKNLNGKTIKLTVGEKTQLVVTTSFGFTTTEKVKWSSSNKKVATVSKKGVVKAKKAGKAKITAKTKSKTFSVTVKGKKKKTKKSNSSNSSSSQTTQPTPSATPATPITSVQAEYVQTLRNYMETNGAVNNKGNKILVSNKGEPIYGIEDNKATGCIDFVYIQEGDGNTATLTFPIPYPSTNVTMDVIATFNSGKLISGTPNINITELKKVNSIVYFKSSGDETVNSLLNQGLAYWDSMLKEKVGFGLFEIGFTSYI